MRALLEVMATDYAGRVNIIIVTDRENWANFLKYKIMAVPTEIFFDNNGNQVMSHIGFLPRDQIEAQFRKMGVK